MALALDIPAILELYRAEPDQANLGRGAARPDRHGEAAVPEPASITVVRRSQLQDALLGDGGERAQA